MKLHLYDANARRVTLSPVQLRSIQHAQLDIWKLEMTT